MPLSSCTKKSICILAATFVILFFVVVFSILPKLKSNDTFVMGGPLAESRGQKGRKLNQSEFYQYENNKDKFDYNLGEMANRGANRPATLNTVNPNWVRRRISTTINSIVPSVDGTAQFPSTSRTNAPPIGDTNWLSNPWV